MKKDGVIVMPFLILDGPLQNRDKWNDTSEFRFIFSLLNLRFLSYYLTGHQDTLLKLVRKGIIISILRKQKLRYRTLNVLKHMVS